MRAASRAADLRRWATVDTGSFNFSRRRGGLTLAPQSFREWNERHTPYYRWDWPHLVKLQQVTDDLANGVIKRLIIQMPPRHGKSECITIRGPVYLLSERPADKYITAAYNTTLAAKFSRRSRNVARIAGISLSEERAAADDWETAAGGGIRAAGVGAGVTGHGANGIFIDDPVKSREEAESLNYREKVWDWYTNDLYTRLEPNGFIVLTMTRWHDDDLAGRILASEGASEWTVLSFPAFAEENDPLGRVEGAALCPDRYNEAALNDIRRTMGEYPFAGLYQQRPRPRDGNMFPREKAEIVDAAPANVKRIRYWDKAGTEAGGAYTAGVKMLRGPDGLIYVEDVQRKQYSALARRQLMKQTAAIDTTSVQVWIEQEPGSGGKESAETSVLDLAGYNVKTEPATGDKVVRAEGFAAQWQAGNVRLVRGEWNKAYLDECESFPNGKYKDQVDASSGAFNKLVLAKSGGVMFV